MKLEVFINRNEWSQSPVIYISRVDAFGHRWLAKPVTLEFEEMKGAGTYSEPTLTFSLLDGPQFMPALVEALARAGFKHESSDVGELKATKAHLEDMRSLAFNKEVP